MATRLDPNNPWAGIPAADSAALDTREKAEKWWTTQPGGGLTPTPVAPTGGTIADAYGFQAPSGTYEDPNLAAARTSQLDYINSLQNPDENQIYNDTLNKFQAQIDATNATYADQLSRARVQGQNRLGQGAAIQARRGLLGSDFGAAQTDTIAAGNEEVNRMIENERAATVSAILRQAKNDAAEEYKTKREEFTKGLDARVAYYEGESERKQSKTSKAVAALIGSGLDITNINQDELQKLATYYGISVDEIKAAYGPAKKAAEAAAEEEARKNQVKLGKDEIIVDAKGNIIARGVTDTQSFTLNPGEKRFQQDADGNWMEVAAGEVKPPNTEKVEVGGRVLLINSDTGETIKDLGAAGSGDPTKPVIVNVDGVDYTLDENGKLVKPELPAGSNDGATQVLQDKIGLIDELLNSKGLAGSVGAYGISRWTPFTPDKAARQEFAAGVNQLINKETIDTLVNLKARGGTLGALSDQERVLLQTAATKIGSWVQRDENGNPTGKFEVSEEAFKRELEAIKTLAQKALQNAQGSPGDDPLNLGFNSGSGGTPIATGSLSEKYESGGNPGAIGYDSTGGYSYGAYQLAHSNAQKFVNQSTYADQFKGLTFNSPAWQKKWKEVAQQDPQGFKDAQQKYVAATHFEPQVKKLSSLGFNVDSLPSIVRDVIWSTAVQHGANNNIIVNALKQVGEKNVATLVKKIYELRWGGGSQFASSTPEVKKSVFNRFFGKGGELETALKNLA